MPATPQQMSSWVQLGCCAYLLSNSNWPPAPCKTLRVPSSKIVRRKVPNEYHGLRSKSGSSGSGLVLGLAGSVPGATAPDGGAEPGRTGIPDRTLATAAREC